MRPDDDERKPVGADLVLPAAAVAFTIYYFTTIWESPWEAQVAAFLIGAILLLLILMLVVRVIRDLLADRAVVSFRPLYGPVEVLPRRLGLLALTLGYVVGIDWLGFTLTSFLFLFLGMWVLSSHPDEKSRVLHFAVVSAVLSLGGWLLFIVAFDTRFPYGWFEYAMQGVLGR